MTRAEVHFSVDGLGEEYISYICKAQAAVLMC